MSIEQTLQDRGNIHGKFADNAQIAYDLKAAVRYSEHYSKLCCVHAEAIDNILMKISRIISGNPYHIDAWRDIAGYAQLVIDYLQDNDNAVDTKTELIKIKK